MTVLHSWRCEGLTLTDALRQCGTVLASGGGPVVALLYSRTRFHLARLGESGALSTATGSVPTLEDIYEARAFSDRGELRWLGIADGDAQAVLLSEENADLAGWKALADLNASCVLDQTYLLWGTADGDTAPGGWCQLVESRIGVLSAPFEVKAGRRVVLRSREYVRLFDHGNAAVVEERLRYLDKEE